METSVAFATAVGSDLFSTSCVSVGSIERIERTVMGIMLRVVCGVVVVVRMRDGRAEHQQLATFGF